MHPADASPCPRCSLALQVFILDSVVAYTPGDARDAEGVVERVLPRLQHANAAVVLSAIKVILKNMRVRGRGVRGKRTRENGGHAMPTAPCPGLHGAASYAPHNQVHENSSLPTALLGSLIHSTSLTRA